MSPRRCAAVLVASAAAVMLLACWVSGVALAAGTLRHGNFSGRVVIVGARRLYLECRGQGRPTVLLEAGSGESARLWLAHFRGRPALMPAVARFTRVCVYDRPGTYWTGGLGQPKSVSRSDPVAMPRTARDMVLDLHALLHAADPRRAAKLRGPYVFGGFSFGGMILRLYATTYPKDVAGQVWIDAQTEWYGEAETRLIPPEQLHDPVPPGFENYSHLERFDLPASSEELRQAQADTPLRRRPTVVLSHSQTAPNPFGFPPGFPPAMALNQAFNASQDKLAALVPGTRRVIARRSGHHIGLDQPNLVIAAIRSVVAQARNH